MRCHSTAKISLIALSEKRGPLLYFLSTGFPTFPPRVLFYLVFVLCATVWIYLTGVWMSVFYASGILLLPHLVLALVGFVYRMTLGRLFGRKSRSSRVASF